MATLPLPHGRGSLPPKTEGLQRERFFLDSLRSVGLYSSETQGEFHNERAIPTRPVLVKRFLASEQAVSYAGYPERMEYTQREGASVMTSNSTVSLSVGVVDSGLPRERAGVRIGSRYRVADGAMRGLEGVVVQAGHRGRILLEVKIFGQETALEIDLVRLEPIDRDGEELAVKAGQ